MTVVIPHSLSEFVSALVASGEYSDENALICDLLRKEQIRRERESVDAKLIESLDGPEATEMTAQDWNEIRAEVERRYALRNGATP
ncbi:MAG: hypothetical protein FJ303_07845 [Planctomycetes bacterium]|nr:hypothetical protein [Planctomycetota bacterium]